MTGAAGGGPGPAGRRMAGLLLDRGVPVRALAPTQDHYAEQPRQPGAEVAARDLREIADVESWGAGNNRAASTTTASGFPDSDAPLEGSGRGVVSARGTGCRCRRTAARPPRGTARPATHPGLVPSAPAWSRASAGARENAPKSRSGPASRRRRSARRPGRRPRWRVPLPGGPGPVLRRRRRCGPARRRPGPGRRRRQRCLASRRRGAGSPPAWSPVSQPAAGRSQLTSSPRRSAIRSRPSSSASSSPQSECSRGGPARPAAHQAPRPAHPGRHRPRAGAPVRVTTPAAMARARIEIPSARAGASARARSRPGLLQPPGRRETRVRTRRSRRPASTRPLTSPAHRAGRVQETGRRGGADGPVVTGTLTLGPGWLCPQLPGGPGFRERQAGRRRRGRWR